MTQLLDHPHVAGRTAAPVMRSAVVVAPGKIEIREVPTPVPAAGEVRVRLQGCGVCALNLPPWEGREWFKYPMPPGQLGHEGWGVVDAIGESVTRVAEGDRVAMLSEHAYAAYDVAPQACVVPLPATIANAPFPGEPLGCAMNIFERSGIRFGQTVAIVGIGFLGAILTRLADQAGARVISVARRPSALRFARDLGAAETISMDDHWKIIEQVKSFTRGVMCDIVVEAVGKQWPLDLAGELTRERGRLVIAGYHQDGLRQVNMQLWNWRGFDIVSAHERDPLAYVRGINAAIYAVTAGALDPAPLYTHRFPLEQLDLALNMTRDRPEGFMKALVMM